MLKNILILSQILISIFAFASDESDAVKAEFSAVYNSYQEKIEKGLVTTSDTIEFWKLSYELGSVMYGSESEETADFALNYSLVINDQDKAKALASESLEILEKIYGESSLELITSLMQLSKYATQHFEKKEGSRIFKRVLSIVKLHGPENTLYQADLNFEFATYTFLHTKPTVTQKYLQKAKTLYETMEEAETQIAKTDFWIGKCQLRRQQTRKALKSFTKSLEVFSSSPSSQFTLTLHQYMAQTYQKLGKGEEATAHYLAIGADRDEDDEYLPLYRMRPTYPINARRYNRGGWVLLSFTVNEKGYPVDPIVIDSEGDEVFHRASKDAILASRFAPKFIDGEPVITEDVRYKYNFGIVEK